MHTPEDSRHWKTDLLRLQEPRRRKNEGSPDESDIQEKAREYLRHCYEQNLDLIAITDHNFSAQAEPRDWFAVHLIEQNKTVAGELSRSPITILPGFEVNIGYHVVCLFAPAKKRADFERCSTILTQLGLAVEARNTQDGPAQLRHNNQWRSLKSLLEIVQDENGGIVIAAHADQERGILSTPVHKDDYSNEFLYCVELTKNPPVPKYDEILNGKNSAWCRKSFHPAWIMSSDSKSLPAEDGRLTGNTLGYRYSWIKMSEPSIESLRQAFLDPESRIIRPENIETDVHPEQSIRHTRIKSISIKNVAFLADQEIHFSPSMTCVIGGRGSGKSTILEYLRIAMGKDRPDGIDKETQERIERVRGTLSSPDSEIEVHWVSAEGVENRIVWKSNKLTLQECELVDPQTYFKNLPVHFFTQHQLNRLTESDTTDGKVQQVPQLLTLVDGFAKNALHDLDVQERNLKLEIQSSFLNIRNATSLEADVRRLQQEYQEIERQWKARSEIQEDAHRHQGFKSEIRYLKSLQEDSGKRFSDVSSQAAAIAASHVPFDFLDSPHAEWFKQLDGKIKIAKDLTAKTIREAVENLETAIEHLKINDPAWGLIKEELDLADVNFSQACAAKGLTPDDVGRLQEINQQRAKKQEELAEIADKIQKHKNFAGDPELLMRQLHRIWKRQSIKRVKAAKRANELARLQDSNSQFIEVVVRYQCDNRHFVHLWEKFEQETKVNGRTKLGKKWDEIGIQLFELFVKDISAKSPWQVLQQKLESSQGIGETDFGETSRALFQHIQENPEKWQDLRCSRVQDSVDLVLFRSDGSTAGSIANGTLSDGQRNTATLALLLAQEGGPLVIDQPEDELDSNFVFNELIPMLRKVKPHRQIIMATHNANLPVNGDAELVYAIEARGGKGEALACGGLDQESVTKAVLDIMEGTEEAFRRRHEKYHF